MFSRAHISAAFVLSFFSLIGLSLLVPALAHAGSDWTGADYGSVKDAPLASSQQWSGLYVGAHAGLATGSTQGTVVGGPFPITTDYDLDGSLYGGHVGYNHQSGTLVLGIEGTYAGGELDGNTTCLILLNCARDLNWLATVEGRIGYAFGNSLVYARGGVAWGELETDAGIFGFNLVRGSETHTGWTAGFGFEHMLGTNLITRIEYAHIDLGDEEHTLNGVVGPIPDTVEAEIDTLRLGVSFKFGN